MLPELESVLNEIHGYYRQGLIKRYPPDPDTKKQNAPAPEAQNGPTQGENDIAEPQKELTPDQQALIALTPQEHKNLCLSAIVGSMEKLPQDDPGYKECFFLSQALRNGWLVDDIPLLRDIYASLSRVPTAHQPEANKILDQLTTVKANRLSDRFDMLDITSTFFYSTWEANIRNIRAQDAALSRII